MGYSIRPGTQIRDFQPDDTDDTFHISDRASLKDILEQAHAKWGEGIRLEDLSITPRHIHTHCLGFDSYDPSDYTDFLVISYAPTAQGD